MPAKHTAGPLIAMHIPEAKELARVLMFEFGLQGALGYAKRKAASCDLAFATGYHEAIPFIEFAILKAKHENA